MEQTVERIQVTGSRSEGKGYIAEITGLSSRYGLERVFVTPLSREGHYPVYATYALEPGKVYEVKEIGCSERRYNYIDASGNDIGWMIDGASDVARLLKTGVSDDAVNAL